MQINPFDLLKNAQKLQEQMGSIQQKLEAITATGASGGGMVEIDMNGRLEVLAIRITPEMLNPGDKEVLQSLIAAAFSNVLEKIKELIGQEIGGAAGLPPSLLSGIF